MEHCQNIINDLLEQFASSATVATKATVIFVCKIYS